MTASPVLPGRASKDADKYLLPGEDVVLATRRHWAVLIEPTLKFLPVFVVGGVLFLVDPDNPVTSVVGLVVVLGSLVYYALRVGEWWMRHFIVTRRRVLLTSGVIVRTVTLLPLRRITDLTWKETLLGQVLGYGTFRFESAGQQQALSEIRFVPNPDHNYRALCAEIFAVEDRERVTAVDADVDEAHAWPDEHDDDPYRGVVQVEPGPMRMQRVAPPTRRDRDRWDEDWQQDRDAERDRARAAGRDAERGREGGRGAGGRTAGGRAPRDGHDTADLPIVDARVSQDAEARELLSSWERFAKRYDNEPERGPDSGTSIYRSGDDTLS